MAAPSFEAIASGPLPFATKARAPPRSASLRSVGSRSLASKASLAKRRPRTAEAARSAAATLRRGTRVAAPLPPDPFDPSASNFGRFNSHYPRPLREYFRRPRTAAAEMPRRLGAQPGAAAVGPTVLRGARGAARRARRATAARPARRQGPGQVRAPLDLRPHVRGPPAHEDAARPPPRRPARASAAGPGRPDRTRILARRRRFGPMFGRPPGEVSARSRRTARALASRRSTTPEVASKMRARRRRRPVPRDARPDARGAAAGPTPGGSAPRSLRAPRDGRSSGREPTRGGVRGRERRAPGADARDHDRRRRARRALGRPPPQHVQPLQPRLPRDPPRVLRLRVAARARPHPRVARPEPALG